MQPQYKNNKLFIYQQIAEQIKDWEDYNEWIKVWAQTEINCLGLKAGSAFCKHRILVVIS